MRRKFSRKCSRRVSAIPRGKKGHRKRLQMEEGDKKTSLSLSKIVKLNATLTIEQKETMKSIGLEGIPHLKYSLLKYWLSRWIVDRFDTVSMTWKENRGPGG